MGIRIPGNAAAAVGLLLFGGMALFLLIACLIAKRRK
jgi:hypothetical protein